MEEKFNKSSQKYAASKMKFIHAIRYFSIALGVFFLINLLTGPRNKNLIERTYHRNPDTYSLGIKSMKRQLNRQKPDLILLGNSYLRDAVYPKQFHKKTKISMTRIFCGGSGAAWWYLTLKNVIDKVSYKPKVLAIFFAGNMLTDNQMGTTGKHKSKIDMISLPEEPLLDKLTFLGGMGSEEYVLNTYLSIFQKRQNFKLTFEREFKKVLGNHFLKMETQEMDTIIEKEFTFENMDKTLYNNHLQKYEDDIFNLKRKSFSFQEELPNSYLPEMIRLAKKNDIQLIFVNEKITHKHLKIRQRLNKYMKELKTYCQEQNIPVLDFSEEQELTEKHFKNRTHLNKKGQKIFTKIFAKKIHPYIKHLKKQKNFDKIYKDIK